ncbi:MAG TPA: PilT/PilU family type 4a pilus ATPase [Egibacteraceae bacterium]|nr:PilT/PilU family type 4a pilus ATPase [Egibacteraceae bacterium]
MSIGLGQLLLAQGLVDEPTLRTASAHATGGDGASLVRTLVAMGAVTEAQVVATVARHLGMAFADTSPGAVDPRAAALLPPEVIRELGALPVAFGQDHDVIVAMADPSNTTALDQVTSLTGLQAVPALAVRSDLAAAIEALDHHPPAPPAAPEPAPGLLAFEQEQAVDLDAVLAELLKNGGSDLHLTAGVPPMIRVNGELQPLDGYPVMTSDELQKMLYGILTQKQRERFENELELDVSYAVPKLARFRVNVFQQRDAIGSVMRVIPFEIKSIEDLGIPPQIVNFAHLPRGFVLVTGPTGSGKSTTLAALIDVINRERAAHIMTVEDPIEFLHSHKRSVVNQRELGTDTLSFAQALKHVLRQDPDVILVGEMRDLETIQVALTAAETGHLVFGTLHTQDAPQTVDRVVDVFPPEQQEQIRVMLGGALQGVVCQQLLKTADGHGRVAACEVMVATPAIRNLIREGKTHQMYSAIQAGKAHGMVTMDQSLANLVAAGKVSHSAALEKCNNVADFNRLCGKA